MGPGPGEKSEFQGRWDAGAKRVVARARVASSCTPCKDGCYCCCHRRCAFACQQPKAGQLAGKADKGGDVHGLSC